jgi:Tfp pilus assembly protein PilE
MAKGSALSNLVPLIILVLVVGVLAAVGFVAYSIANDVGSQTRQKMEKRNISFTKEGMKVGVKEKTAEQQTDSAQKSVMTDRRSILIDS